MVISTGVIVGFVALVLFIVVLFVLYRIGAKSNQNNASRFKEQCKSDLFNSLASLCKNNDGNLKQQVDALLNNESKVILADNIEKIELQIEMLETNKNSCQRILGITHIRDGKFLLTSAKREYDWDFLPNDIADQLIRTAERKITVVLYQKSN